MELRERALPGHVVWSARRCHTGPADIYRIPSFRDARASDREYEDEVARHRDGSRESGGRN